jgi:aryl-alcohol dehydrogenase-like predicted oxidoreductase
MLYREFGKTGWKISSVAFGGWNISNQWGEMDDATAERIIRAGFDGGMNLFDVAESYGIPNGLSELRVGKALKDVRDKVYFVSKIGHWGKRTGQGVPKTSVDMIRLCGHACAGRLRTEWVDMMLCHEGSIQDPSVYIEGFEVLKKEGFIREYGISTDHLEVLKKFYEMSDGACSAVEVNYSLLNRKPEAEFLTYCREKQLGVLIRGPIAMGVLSGRYNADTVFTDVRSRWNKDGNMREEYEEFLEKLVKVQDAIGTMPI